MLKFFSSVLLLLFCIQSDAFSQNQTPYPKAAFFENEAFYTSGLEGLRSSKPGKEIKQLPGFRYFNAETGLARIICYPVDLPAWRDKIQKILDLKQYATQTTKINGEIKKISSDTALQKKYKIYAFYCSPKDVVVESDLQSKVSWPKFPCIIYTYQKKGAEWLPLKKTMIKDDAAYATLMYETVLPQ